MKSFAKVMLVLAIFGGLAYAAERREGVIQMGHEEVAAAFGKGAMLLQTNHYKIMAGRRTGPGAVEIHKKDTDIFYIVDGTATFVTGGTAAQVKEVSPEEFRGERIVGGDVRHLAKGDVVVIPKGTPHWFTESSTPFLYFVVKVRE